MMWRLKLWWWSVTDHLFWWVTVGLLVWFCVWGFVMSAQRARQPYTCWLPNGTTVVGRLQTSRAEWTVSTTDGQVFRGHGSLVCELTRQ